jgi:spore coat protein U-like protein
VTATPLVFDAPLPTKAKIDSSATITIACPPNTPFVIDIDDGQHGKGNAKRRVKHAYFEDFLDYDIYKDPPKSQVWGKGKIKQLAGNSGPRGTAIYTVYGRLHATTSMRSGGYFDTLVIQVDF